MGDAFETFLLYYTAWQEREVSLKEFKEYVLTDVGEDGLKKAIEDFRAKRLERGNKNTLYDIMHPKVVDELVVPSL